MRLWIARWWQCPLSGVLSMRIDRPFVSKEESFLWLTSFQLRSAFKLAFSWLPLLSTGPLSAPLLLILYCLPFSFFSSICHVPHVNSFPSATHIRCLRFALLVLTLSFGFAASAESGSTKVIISLLAFLFSLFLNSFCRTIDLLFDCFSISIFVRLFLSILSLWCMCLVHLSLA